MNAARNKTMNVRITSMSSEHRNGAECYKNSLADFNGGWWSSLINLHFVKVCSKTAATARERGQWQWNTDVGWRWKIKKIHTKLHARNAVQVCWFRSLFTHKFALICWLNAKTVEKNNIQNEVSCHDIYCSSLNAIFAPWKLFRIRTRYYVRVSRNGERKIPCKLTYWTVYTGFAVVANTLTFVFVSLGVWTYFYHSTSSNYVFGCCF